MTKPKADIAIIGGTGVYDPDIIENAERVKVHTPYGSPSATVTLGDYGDTKIAFIQDTAMDTLSHLTRYHSEPISGHS